MFKYLPNGLIGLGMVVAGLVMSGPLAAFTGSRAVAVIFLGLTMACDLLLRGFLDFRRKRRLREPQWFLVPSVGGHFGLITTWLWGSIVVVIGGGMLVSEIQTAHENWANQQAYEQRLAEKARQASEKPVEQPPKKTGFELDLRKEGKKYWVVMTSHHPEAVNDIKLTVHYLIGNNR
jgi:hypothetical protein